MYIWWWIGPSFMKTSQETNWNIANISRTRLVLKDSTYPAGLPSPNFCIPLNDPWQKNDSGREPSIQSIFWTSPLPLYLFPDYLLQIPGSRGKDKTHIQLINHIQPFFYILDWTNSGRWKCWAFQLQYTVKFWYYQIISGTLGKTAQYNVPSWKGVHRKPTNVLCQTQSSIWDIDEEASQHHLIFYGLPIENVQPRLLFSGKTEMA